MIYKTSLEIVLGKKSTVKVLRELLLHPKKGFGIRELGKLLGIEHTSVRNALSDLSDQNLIYSESRGRSHIMYLNEGAYFVPTLKKLFIAEETTLQQLKKAIIKGMPKKYISFCAIYGSIARGDERAPSDIDILIVTSNKSRVEDWLAGAQDRVITKFGNVISPIIKNKKEWKSTYKYLKENINKHNIKLYEQ